MSPAGLHAEVRLTRGRLHLHAALTAAGDETVAVLGPNGAGKTTLLRALAGLTPLRAGRVELDGAVLDEPATGTWVPPERRPIGYVFQEHVLFPHLSVVENVAFGLRTRGVPRRRARERAHGLLDRVGVGHHALARPGALSGGEAQRVALARALAVEPRLLLLDEPLAALDAAGRLDVRADLRRQLESFEGTRLLVTHDPVEAMVLADRLVVLEDGHLVQAGTPGQISRRPRSPYVARLVGLNLYRGTATGTTVRLPGGGQLHLAAPAPRPGGRVLATVRPQSVALHRRRPEGTPRNVWPGTVVASEPDGGRVRVQVDAAIPVVAEITPAAVAELGLRPGSDVWVAIKATDIEAYPA
ncbi:MAG: ABC transporter ATP-binding protein [Acidimicrobiales bacterium]